MYKTKLPLFASKEKHVGKKHYLFLHKDFDRSKKLSQFTFNGQTPCHIEYWRYFIYYLVRSLSVKEWSTSLHSTNITVLTSTYNHKQS
jgi:hypothetical protein